MACLKLVVQYSTFRLHSVMSQLKTKISATVDDCLTCYRRQAYCLITIAYRKNDHKGPNYISSSMRLSVSAKEVLY